MQMPCSGFCGRGMGGGSPVSDQDSVRLGIEAVDNPCERNVSGGYMQYDSSTTTSAPLLHELEPRPALDPTEVSLALPCPAIQHGGRAR